MKMKSSWALLATLALVIAAPHSAAVAAPIEVDLELALVIDVSGSVDATDYALQQQGYAEAFQSSDIQNAILNGQLGKIAVNVIYFSSGTSISGWTLIDSVAAAEAFASSILAQSRPAGIGIGTGLANGMNVAAATFGNDYIGTRQVMDVSGDGSESIVCNSFQLSCGGVQAARDAFLAGGDNRTINAIWINDRNFFGNTGSESIDSLEYGALNVIGGTGAFQLAVTGFDTFGEGISEKILREVNPVPAPGPLALLGIGLLGLGAMRRART